MQISVRSYLTTGTVAVLGAGAIALTPPAPVTLPAVPAPVIADVTLTGVSLSLDQVVGILTKLGLGDVVSPIVNLLPANLLNNFVAELSDQALSLVTTAVKGAVGDLGTIVGGLISGPDSIINTVATAVGSIPKAVITAVQTLGAGDISATLNGLVASVTAPLSGIGQVITDAAKAFEVQVTKRIGDLVNAVPNLLVNVVQAVVTNDFQAVVDMVKTAIAGITNLFGGSLPAASTLGASVRAVTAVAPAAGAAVPAVSAPAVAALPAAEVPASVAVAPRVVSRAGRSVAQPHSVAVAPNPAAAVASEAVEVETASPAEVAVAARAEQSAPVAEPVLTASPRSKPSAHARGPVSRAAKASSVG